MKRGDRITLRIDALAFGGDAVARAADGRVVFVAGAAPGDEVLATVDEAKRDFARVTTVAILTAGAARVAPRCPLVERCGGCQWQAVAIDAQRSAKQSIVVRALSRLGVAVESLRTPSAPFGYRTRARFTVGESGSIGFQEQRSHRVVDVATCPLLDPALDAALGEARRALASGMAAGGTLAGLLGRDGAVHLAITGARDRGAAARTLVGRAGIVGVVVDGQVIGARDVDASDGDEPPFYAAADGFAQASRAGNRTLRALVAEMTRATDLRVLELHAGDGNFTRDLAVSASVMAIEGDAAAVARLRRNVPRADARAEPVERAAERLAASGERFDLVLIDPPRAGARPLIDALARLSPRLIYVSCDPMTLARDLGDLATRGLVPVRAIGVDMMPHTFHVECVVELAARG